MAKKMWGGCTPAAARWHPRAKRGSANSHYSITLDLNTYVAEAKIPSLQAFASSRIQQIAQWTIDQSSNTDTEIFNLWHRRFVKSLTIIQPEMQIKKQTMSTVWTTIATLKTKMNENKSSYITAGLNMLNSYSITVTNLAIEIGKRKEISSSSSNNNSSSDNSNSSTYQDEVNVPTDDENTLTIKEIIFGMTLKKIRSMGIAI